MSEPALPPSASTTLVIVLGASAWPNSPGFQASKAFAHAAQGFRDYLLDPGGFGLPAANLLDLFDAPASASDQLEHLGSFLEQQSQAHIASNQPTRDVLVYFLGHGGFVGSSHDFYLMPRRANASSLRASGLSIDALADVLREKAHQTRRCLFLDCCFAAAAFRSFQRGPDQTAIEKTLDAFAVQSRSSGFPRRGTTLLCSSDQKSPSLLLPDESCTMFSRAVLDVLRNGDLHRPHPMSLRDLKELAEDRLMALPEKNAPRPGLFSPDQSEGNVADVPLFPNPRAEEERHHQGEEAKWHQAEEQAREVEKGRLRAAREEQVEQPPEMRKGLDSDTQSGSGVVHGRVSRRTVVLGLGIAGLTVAGGGLTWLLSSRTFLSSTSLRSTPTPQPPKVIYVFSDVSNNGRFTGEGVWAVRASDGTTLWHSQWNNESSENNPPVVVDGVVYVPTTHFGRQGFADAGVVHALRASDGSTLWSYRVKRGGASVYIANELVFVDASPDGYQAFYVLRAGNGTLLWKYQVDMEDIALPQAVANGVVYTSSYDLRSSRGNAYAFRVSDGTMLWKYHMNIDVKGYPQSAAVDNGVVYIASPMSYTRFTYPYDPTKDVQNTNSTIYALRASDGTLLWQYEIDKDSSFLSLEVIDGVLYATSGSQKNSNGIIYALQKGNGSLLWKYQVHLDYRYYSGQIEATITEGVVYIASQGDIAILNALRAKDGSLLWQHNLGSGSDAIIVPANGMVYVGVSSDSSFIDALRVSDGSLLWRYRLHNGSYISALVAARTTLYVGILDHNGPDSVLTLQLSNGSLLRHSQGGSVRFMTGGS